MMNLISSSGVSTFFFFDNGWVLAVHPHEMWCSTYAVIPIALYKGDIEDTGEWTNDKYEKAHASDKDVALKLAEVAGWPDEPHWAKQKANAAGMLDALVAGRPKKNT